MSDKHVVMCVNNGGNIVRQGGGQLSELPWKYTKNPLCVSDP